MSSDKNADKFARQTRVVMDTSRLSKGLFCCGPCLLSTALKPHGQPENRPVRHCWLAGWGMVAGGRGRLSLGLDVNERAQPTCLA